MTTAPKQCSLVLSLLQAWQPANIHETIAKLPTKAHLKILRKETREVLKHLTPDNLPFVKISALNCCCMTQPMGRDLKAAFKEMILQLNILNSHELKISL